MVQTRSQTSAITREKELKLAQANTVRIEKELKEATREAAQTRKLLAATEQRLASERLLAKQKSPVSSMGEEGPSILGPDEPAAGTPPCYLAWGRFMTQVEYRKSSGKTFEEVTQMIDKVDSGKESWQQVRTSLELARKKAVSDRNFTEATRLANELKQLVGSDEFNNGA